MGAEDGGSEDSVSAENSCHKDGTRVTSYARRMAAVVADGAGRGTGILEASEVGILVLIGLGRDLGEDEVQVLGVLAFVVEGRAPAAVAADFVVVEGVLMTKTTTTKKMQVRSALILILMPLIRLH